MSQFKDDLILSHIFLLSRKIQNNERVWRNARIIKFLSDIIRLNQQHIVEAFLKWLDSDEEREFYSSIILN